MNADSETESISGQFEFLFSIGVHLRSSAANNSLVLQIAAEILGAEAMG
jgi:hypothetical protein